MSPSALLPCSGDEGKLAAESTNCVQWCGRTLGPSSVSADARSPRHHYYFVRHLRRHAVASSQSMGGGAIRYWPSPTVWRWSANGPSLRPHGIPLLSCWLLWQTCSLFAMSGWEWTLQTKGSREIKVGELLLFAQIIGRLGVISHHWETFRLAEGPAHLVAQMLHGTGIFTYTNLPWIETIHGLIGKIFQSHSDRKNLERILVGGFS